MRIFLTGVLAALLAASLPAATVRNLAGTGVSGATGDGGPAVEAQVGNPYGLTIGPDGALYVCEIDNHRIRRIDLKSGKISTFVGSGAMGNSGDGGPATKALVNEPYEVRFDKAGNLYFVDMKNANVRRVDRKTGIISTVAGTGEPGFSGDGGPAVKAQLNQPHSIALDPQGDIYIADIHNNRIRRVDRKTGRISTFSGTGEKSTAPDGSSVKGAALNEPRAIVFDAKGDMYLALRNGNAVYRIDMRKLTLHHIAGTGEKGYDGDGGPAKLAKLSGPKGIDVSPDGAVLIADTESHTIRRIDLASGMITTVLGDGTRHDGPVGDPLKCGLARPHGIDVDSNGVLYVSDSENHRVRILK